MNSYDDGWISSYLWAIEWNIQDAALPHTHTQTHARTTITIGVERDVNCDSIQRECCTEEQQAKATDNKQRSKEAIEAKPINH